MKKLIVSVLAIAGLVACMNDEVVRVQNGGAIAFENTFVQNATRANDPSTTTDNIQEFSVWGYMNAVDGVVFDDELVSRSGDAWTYNEIQYWLPGNNYYFAAFAGDRSAVDTLPQTMDANGLGEVKFTNVDGTNDILYAEAVVENAKRDNAPVALTFQHLLSKVKFTFKNGFQNNNNFVVVKDITMNVAETANVDLSADELPWTDLAGTKTLEFGHMNNAEKLTIGASKSSDNERLTIPAGADYEYTINFVVEVYNGDARGLVKDMEVKLTGLELVAGHAYNLMATINQENLDLNAIEFTAEVAEWIEQDVDGGAVEGEVTFVTSAAQIQDILDNATKSVSILFGGDITDGDVNILQKEGIDVTINGNGHKFTGVFNVNGDARAAGKETLTFTGINFEASEKKTFISAPSKVNNRYNYSHNVTIENCTFTGAYDQGVEVGAASFTGAYNIVMKNCEAYKMHSLLQTQSIDNTVLVENVKVVACKNGVSFGNTAYPTLRNAEIDAEAYGVRADGNASRGNLVIENSTIEANQPVVIRKVTTNGYKVNVDEVSALKTAEAFQVIFTKGSDDAEYVAPTVDFTFNGPATTAVFPGFAPADATAVKNVAELTAALNDANVENIVLTEGDYGVIVAKSNKTIIAAEGAKVDAVVFNGSDNVTLKNIVFDAATAVISYDGSGNAKQYANIMNDNNGGSNTPAKGASDIVIDGCTFTGAFANGGTSIAFTDQSRSGGFTGNVTIKNCTFATTNAYYNIYGHYCGNSTNGKGNFVIENNTFNTEFTQGGPIYLGRYASNVPVVVKGNAFNTVASLGDAIYVQDHSNYGVSIAAENNTFAN